ATGRPAFALTSAPAPRRSRSSDRGVLSRVASIAPGDDGRLGGGCQATRRAVRAWAWAMATARASAESLAVLPAVGSRRAIIQPTWALSAEPVPTTAFFTTVAAYSATSRPARAGTIIAMARAWPSFS